MQVRLYLSSKEPERAASAEALLRNVLGEGGTNLFTLTVVDVDRDPAIAKADNITHTPTIVVSQDKEIYVFAGDPGLDEGHLRYLDVSQVFAAKTCDTGSEASSA